MCVGHSRPSRVPRARHCDSHRPTPRSPAAQGQGRVNAWADEDAIAPGAELASAGGTEELWQATARRESAERSFERARACAEQEIAEARAASFRLEVAQLKCELAMTGTADFCSEEGGEMQAAIEELQLMHAEQVSLLRGLQEASEVEERPLGAGRSELQDKLKLLDDCIVLNDAAQEASWCAVAEARAVSQTSRAQLEAYRLEIARMQEELEQDSSSGRGSAEALEYQRALTSAMTNLRAALGEEGAPAGAAPKRRRMKRRGLAAS